MTLVLAVIMLLGTTVTASAAAPAKTYTITLKAEKQGRTYKAYQIFKGDLSEKDGSPVLSNIEWGSGVASEKNSLITALKAHEKLSKLLEDITTSSTAAEVAEKLTKERDDSEAMIAFADVTGEHLSSVSTESSSGTGSGSNYIYTISGLEAGYYLVMDETPDLNNEEDAYSRNILQVVGDVTAQVKPEIPEVEKKILEGTNKVDANTAGVGKQVSYEITGQVPDYRGYDYYYYIINDTLSKGLTFDKDSVTVKIGAKILTKDTDYKLYASPDLEAGKYTFRIAFKDIMNYNIGNAVTVQYAATVNENAVIGGMGNDNDVTLSYSNNPNYDYDGNTNPYIPGDQNPTGETPKDTVKTFVAQLDITKKKDSEGGEALAGAEFTLTGTSKETVLQGKEYYEKDTNGTYWLLKAGTYTTENPNTDGMNKDKYASLTDKYTKKTATTTTEVETAVVMTGTSDAQGKITFKGLGAGTYKIEETKVPEGYNKAADLKFNITCEPPVSVMTGQEKAEWGVTGKDTAKIALNGGSAQSGIFETTIVNKSGATLPSTGGMGTTLIYVLGTIMAVGAGILLVVRRRMRNEK